MGLFKRLFCKHQWETIRIHTARYNNGEVAMVTHKYKCTKCGKVKINRMYPNAK